MSAAAIILYSWATFVVVWIFLGVFAKKSVRPINWIRAVLIRLAMAVIVIALLSTGRIQVGGIESLFSFPSPAPIATIGAVLCVLGIAFAIWARVYLGSNWGAPRSLRLEPELVTTGPYSHVRHPIYSGILLALAGSALASGIGWWLIVLIVGIYFITSARREEADMAHAFPSTYPDYKTRTKMLVPFIF